MRTLSGWSLAVILCVLTASSARGAVLFDTDFKNGNGGLTQSATSSNAWTYGLISSPTPHSGWFVNGIGRVATSSLTTPIVTVGKGPVTVSFNHRYNFEGIGPTGFDGGQLRVSVNNGAFNVVPLSDFTSNAPNTTIGSESSLIDGQLAFSNTSAGYSSGLLITSVAKLSSLSLKSGDQIRFQFRGSWDDSVSVTNPNWLLETLTIVDTYVPPSGGIPEPSTLALASIAGLAGLLASRRRGRHARAARQPSAG